MSIQNGVALELIEKKTEYLPNFPAEERNRREKGLLRNSR
jgi:hypothetical protein